MGTRNIVKADQSPVDLTSIKNIENFELVYHEDEDTLFLRPDKVRPATSIDWNGEMWVRVDIATGEIIGLEIDDFEAVFLKRHPNLETAWKEVKPLCKRQKSQAHKEASWEAFVRILLDFLMAFFRNTPQQSKFNVVPATSG